MDMRTGVRPIEILLVEDAPGDVRWTVEALKEGKFHNNLSVVGDGEEALAFLRRDGKYARAPRPDLILLDLNLPIKDGREVLAEIKADQNLKDIPIIILTMSMNETDVLDSYNMQASCYITKPVSAQRFVEVVRSIESFWFSVVKLPTR